VWIAIRELANSTSLIFELETNNAPRRKRSRPLAIAA
jgi:hypothetical protein